MEKKIPDRNKTPPACRLDDVEEFLKKLANENEIIDDHGQAIIGGRDRKPVHLQG